MAFIPTTTKTHAYLLIFLTSVSQYKKASINKTHPPLENTNAEVLMRLMMGVIFSQSNP